MNCLYIIGEPGAGKSTLVQHLTDGLPYEESLQPFAHRRYDAGPLELGRRREHFSGTDALAMNVQPIAKQFIEGVRPAMLLAEGDRLANRSFFEFLRAVGYDLRIVYLDAYGIAADRRAARGSKQNESWVKGRMVKMRNLAMSEPNVQWIDASGPYYADWADQLSDPVALALRSAQNALREGATL